MVSMIAEDGILCQKKASLLVWYGFSHLLLNSEVLNILSKFRSHLKLLSFMLFAFSFNKLHILHFAIFSKYTENAYFIFKKYIQLMVSIKDIFFIHLKTFCLVANSLFVVYFKAKLFPFLLSKIWTIYL